MSSKGTKQLLFSTIFVSMLVNATCTTETEISSLVEHDNGQLKTIASILQHIESSIRNQEVYHNQTTMIHSQIERDQKAYQNQTTMILSQLADTQTRMARDQEASQHQTTLTLSQLANTQNQLVNAQAEMANAHAEMASVLNQVVHMLHDMNECFSRPCQNQGQCVNNNNGYGYTCECQAGWTGVNCEKGRSDNPEIQTGGQLTEEVESYLVCIANNTYPAPNLRWYNNGIDISENATTQMTKNSNSRFDAISTLTFTPSREDNQHLIKCLVQHESLSEPYPVHELKIDVAFCPKSVELTCPDSLVASQYAVVTCKSASSNPRSGFAWTIGGYKFNPTGSRRYDTDEYAGETTTQSHVDTYDKTHNGAQVKCCGSVQETSSALNCSDDICHTCTLDIRFRPTIVIENRTTSANEGLTAILKCEVDGNPKPDIMWYKLDSLMTESDRVTITQKLVRSPYSGAFSVLSTLQIRNIVAADYGEYDCRASNPVGVDDLNITLTGKNNDDCASALCLNGGQCIDGVNQYTCQCIAGWTGGFCEIKPAPCQADLFTCYDGSCIPSNLVCDGFPDCEQSTDEVETMCATCPYKYLCTNGRCVELEDVCDGTNNCEDNSDEDRICVDIPTAIASVDGSTITLQWNALLELTGNPKRNITQYVVTVTRQDGGKSQTVFVPAVDDTAYIATGLQPVTAYVIEIDVVIDTDGQGELTYDIGIPEFKANTTTSCLDYLGMENGDIPDGNLQASSSYSTGHSPHYARLNGVRGWLAIGDKSKPWIQADIGFQTYVSGVATQGNTGYWVTSFKVSTFSTTASYPEIYIRDSGGSIKVFQGNTDYRSTVTSTFSEPVIARIVRITCLEKGEYHWGMRFEILGCKQDDMKA